MGGNHIYAAIVIRISSRAAILSVTQGHTQGREQTIVTIVERLSHKTIIVELHMILIKVLIKISKQWLNCFNILSYVKGFYRI